MLKSSLFRLLYVIVGLMAIYSLSRSVYDLWRRQDLISAQKQVLNKLEAENKRLQADLKESQTPEYIERIAREKLNLAKPGETIILFDKNPVTDAGESNRLPEIKPSWSVWWKLFF
jgi:cell division protein DivIC